MPFPVWLAGMKITAERLAAMQPLSAVKSVTEGVTNSTTMQNDDELKLAVESSASYSVRLMLVYDAPTASDIKIGWTGPSGSSMVWSPQGATIAEGNSSSAATMNVQSRTITETAALGGSNSTGTVAQCEGQLTTGVSAGTLQFQWAQNTASTTATNVRTGSTLIAWRIL